MRALRSIEDLRWIPESDRIAWHITGHNGASTYDGVGTETNAANGNCTGSELHAILDYRAATSGPSMAKSYAMSEGYVPTEHGVVVHDDSNPVIEPQAATNDCLRPKLDAENPLGHEAVRGDY